MASKQKTIADFFKPGSKRMSSESSENIVEEPKPKKPKLDEDLAKDIEVLCKERPALHKSICQTWFSILRAEFEKPYFLKLSQFVDGERKKNKVFPPPHNVWSWTCTPFDQTKVVILGQDPYHNDGQAHGLCFSVQDVHPPPSLVNIFKELEKDIDGFKHPGHGNLNGWARQGVLLLNTVLTVKAHNAKSHANQGWETFTDAVIKKISEKLTGIVFLLWGAPAINKTVLIDKKKHHILTTSHPSPLSAHRGFLGSRHFSKCNELLEKQGKTPIDWKSLPAN
ncbi:uracil-DNA glycosylase-like [Neocloeon triangulifer]|uniref:uracil-DNA glycosylase-like n=1 Tax=Neocloeon triangulifer TaxID=2078957 RepID=UPI00286F0024|nr:uracil-DNA glycosylase-like [Neocloeon triangulifer]